MHKRSVGINLFTQSSVTQKASQWACERFDSLKPLKMVMTMLLITTMMTMEMSVEVALPLPRFVHALGSLQAAAT